MNFDFADMHSFQVKNQIKSAGAIILTYDDVISLKLIFNNFDSFASSMVHIPVYLLGISKENLTAGTIDKA